MCLAAVVFAAVAQRRARTRFATANLIRRVLPPARTFRRAAGTTLVTAAMALMVLALVDVRWGKVWRDVPQKGIEVMFVLDVSRSMLADDAAPNRLERAKQQIKDTVDEMAGDRVGLRRVRRRRQAADSAHHALRRFQAAARRSRSAQRPPRRLAIWATRSTPRRTRFSRSRTPTRRW